MDKKLSYRTGLFSKKQAAGGLVFIKPAIACFLAVGFIVVPTAVGRQSEEEAAEKLAELGEEELLMFYDPNELIVTSSARRPQPLHRAASAMTVITSEEIRQAGATKLSDILRLVPGMEVARKSGYSYNVGIRGFAEQAHRRMQILMDGRPLYDDFTGGMELAYYPLFYENIERIEVIRGPGGVVWGLNAMNGVINIITKKAADTQGGLIYGGFGTRALQQGYLRYGGSEKNLDWRASVGADHDNGFGSDRGNAVKDYTQDFASTGRIDYTINEQTTLSLWGGHKNTTNYWIADRLRNRVQYYNLLLTREFDDDSVLRLRWAESFFKWRCFLLKMRTRKSFLELQYNFTRDNHNFVCGIDYTKDKFATGGVLWSDYTDPDHFVNDQANTFIEDEITLADNLWLTIGARWHYDEVCHYDWAGRTALVWEVAPKHFLRAAVSRAFRKPQLAEVFSHQADGAHVFVQGNENLLNERLISYELGYRGQWADNLEMNVEGFLNKHENLIARTDIGTWPQVIDNMHDITTYGVETSIDWRPYDWWLVRASHTYEHQTEENEMNRWPDNWFIAMTVPHHKLALTNRFYLDDSTTLNTQLYWCDTFYNYNINSGHQHPDRIDPYLTFDIRLARKIWNDKAELAFGVKNLTEHFHYEGSDDGSEVPRQVYFQFFYKF